MKEESILEMEGTDIRWLTRDQLSGLTRDQLSGLTRDQLSWLTGDQLSGLTRAQLSGLTGAQLSWLTGDQLSGLTGAQLSWLTGDQLSWLTGAQLSWLTRAQLSGLKDLESSTPAVENPYTMILGAIGAKDCALEMGQWHTCKTTHCLGGWIVILAGEEGRKLEEKTSTETAAALILRKSRPDAPLPNFYASNAAAMAFIKARAKEETK